MAKYFFIYILIYMSGLQAQVTGCTDPLSQNYNSQATVNDGSCTYGYTIVSPALSVTLIDSIKETSGAIIYNNSIYTHNDSNDINLYKPDITTGEILSSIPITGAVNNDWEEIAQDQDYIYIGDFGNNSGGNRTNLKIYKISKTLLTDNDPNIEVINFSYSNQTDFSNNGGNNTNFDCEAMVIDDSGIYLFTKQWISGGTSVYFLPKVPGNHIASLHASFNVNGLITGATYNAGKKIVVLSGYTSTVQPFLYLLYDYEDTDFFSGNKRKIMLDKPFHQIESVSNIDGLTFYVTNEQLLPLNIQPKLHIFNLTDYLQHYFDTAALAVKKNKSCKITIYPNPAGEVLTIQNDTNANDTYIISDLSGRIVQQGILLGNTIHINHLQQGIYNVKFKSSQNTYRFIKK